jgi:hypothetical protein
MLNFNMLKQARKKFKECLISARDLQYILFHINVSKLYRNTVHYYVNCVQLHILCP